MPDLIYEKFPKGNYALFTLNRPERLNALGQQMHVEMADAMDDFDADPEMRCGVLTGTGRAFCAGADLKEMAERNAAMKAVEDAFARGEIDGAERAERLAPLDMFKRRSGFTFSENPKPFIAAINGLCLAGGMERATDCDFRIASTEAYFGLFEVKRGIIAGYAVEHLPRIMPYGAVMQLLLTADRMSVEDALRFGFVNEVHPPEKLMPRATELAEKIGKNAPLAVQASKAVASFWRRHGMEESNRTNQWVMRSVWSSEDAREGPQAFAEKREPKWKGR